MHVSVTCTLLIIHSGCLTQNYVNFVDFEVLRILILKMTVVRGVTPYSLIEKYVHYGVTCYGWGLGLAALETLNINGKQAHRTQQQTVPPSCKVHQNIDTCVPNLPASCPQEITNVTFDFYREL